MTEKTRSNGGDPAHWEPDPRAVGKRIAIARKEAGGMTQGELADALQVSKRSVAAYEAGAVLPFRYLGRIETAVSKPKAWLLYGDEALPNPNAILARLDGVLRRDREAAGRTGEPRRAASRSTRGIPSGRGSARGRRRRSDRRSQPTRRAALSGDDQRGRVRGRQGPSVRSGSHGRLTIARRAVRVGWMS